MAAPFRLACVVKRYPRLSETFIINEMLELQRQGIEVTVVALGDPGEAIVHENVRALQAPIYYLPPKACLAFEKLAVRSLPSFSGNASLLGPDTLQRGWPRDDYIAWLQAAMFAPFLSSLGIRSHPCPFRDLGNHGRPSAECDDRHPLQLHGPRQGHLP